MAEDVEEIGQGEIEDLLRQAGGTPATSPGESPPKSESASLSEADVAAWVQNAGSPVPSPATEGGPTGLTASPAIPPEVAGEADLQPGDIDALLQQAQEALASVEHPADVIPPGIVPFQLKDFSGAPPSTKKASLELVRDVELDLSIELGRTHMYLDDVLKLERGSVVSLDKPAGDPVDVYVNGRLIARGEVLVLNDNFCIRVAELVAGETKDG